MGCSPVVRIWRVRSRRWLGWVRGCCCDARRMIAEHGYDPVYGARPLRRYIAHEVETKIGRALLRGDIAGGGKIRITVENGELTVGYSEPALAA